MSGYKGLFTYDIDNHRYVPVEQADGIISNMNYKPKEEPKEYWYLDLDGRIFESHDENGITKDMKEIGNYFETKEEAEQAVEKLKAWKRLKDKGFKFVEWQQYGITEDGVMDGAVYFEHAKNVNRSDLDLFFGGEG